MSAKPSAVKIGWATRDITTDKPVSIPGQFNMRISQGIIDPVSVTALAIANESDSVIFLSADIVVIRNCVLDKIRARVTELDASVPVIKILMNATHTHAGPSVYGSKPDWRSGSSTVSPEEVPIEEGIEIASGDEYQKFFVEQAAAAVVEAWQVRSAGGIAWGYGYAVVAHSRRVVYFDDVSKRPGAARDSRSAVHGHAQMYGNTNDPMFSHYEAGADHFINLLYTFDTEGRLTGALVNVPCPSQNSESEKRLSASFWNEVREALRSRHGDIFLLPQSAAGGDLAPRVLHYREAQARRFKLKYGDNNPRQITEYAARLDIAERIVEAFDEVLAWARKDIQTEMPIAHTVETVNLSRRLISDEEYAYAVEELAKQNEIPFKLGGDDPMANLNFNSILVAGRSRFRRVIGRYESQKESTKLPMELHVLRIGDIAFASNRFELYMDYQHRIQARSPFIQTFVVQLAGTPGDGGGTYLPTERGEWGKGYSASMYCNEVSSKGGQELVEETLRLLNDLADSKD